MQYQTPLRVVTYSRVSTDDQAEYGTGLETQDLDNIRLVERLGATLVGKTSDPGVSGTIYPRDGLEAALALIEKKQANAVVVHRVDRLGRKAYIPQIVFERIKNAGGRLFTVEDGEVTDQNIIMFSLRCGMAQSDYSRLVLNMKSGKRRMAEQGQVPSRAWSPYGYHIVKKLEAGYRQDEAGKYVVVEEEAVVVRTIFERFAAGDSLNTIAQHLHDQGIPIPRPEHTKVTRSCWHATMVSRILKNTAYKGYVMWGKTKAVYRDISELTFEERLNCRNQNKRKRIDVPTPTEEQTRIEVPSIISTSLWEACERQREDNKAFSGFRNDRKHKFASLVVCQNCGRRMNSAHAHYQNRKTEERPIFYRCKDHAPSQNTAGIVCNRGTYKETEIRAHVRRFFLALTDTPEFVIAAFQAFQNQRHSGYSPEEHTQVINSLHDLDDREKSTAQAYARSIQLGTRPEVFESLLTEIALKRKQLMARKAALEAMLTEQSNEDPTEIAEIVAAYAHDILEVLDSHTLESAEQNKVLRRVLKSITPIEDGFRIESHALDLKSGDHVHIHEAPVTGIVTPVK